MSAKNWTAVSLWPMLLPAIRTRLPLIKCSILSHVSSGHGGGGSGSGGSGGVEGGGVGGGGGGGINSSCDSGSRGNSNGSCDSRR